MLYLVVEDKYHSYPWCQRTLQGLWDEVRKKKVSIQEVSDVKHITASGSDSAVLLLGASEEWVKSQAWQAYTLGIHPIVLSNRVPTPQDISFSSVTLDICDSIRQAVDYLQGLGCSRLALYGCNQYATSDPWRENAFRTLMGKNASVFYNRESLEQTFADFWIEHEIYDGIICANGYAALSLVRHLQDKNLKFPDDLYIVSCGDLFLSRISSPSITSISDNYEHFGRAALSIYNLVVKEETISAVTIQLHSQLHPRMTTGNLPYNPVQTPYLEQPASSNPFFADTEISEMVRLETLLTQCDEIDMEVIRLLILDKSYAAIADSCFISETAVKYRLRKMEEICNVSTRKALTSFLRKFF